MDRYEIYGSIDPSPLSDLGLTFPHKTKCDTCGQLQGFIADYHFKNISSILIYDPQNQHSIIYPQLARKSGLIYVEL